MVATLLDEARAEFPKLHMDEVDVAAFPATAVRYRVLSTPAIAINGRPEFQGVPRAEALRARLQAIAAEGPPAGGPAAAGPPAGAPGGARTPDP